MSDRLATMRALARRWPGTVVRMVIAAIAIVWITRSVDLHATGEAVRRIPAWALVGSVLSMLASVVCATQRWAVLVSAANGRARLGFPAAFRQTLEATFLNNLPSGLTGDAMRAIRVRNLTGGAGASLAVLVVDRLAGLAGLFLLAGTVSLVGEPGLNDRAGALLRASALGGALLAAVGLIASTVTLRSSLRAHPRVAPIASLVQARSTSIVVLSMGSQLSIALSMVVLLAPLAPTVPSAALLRVAPLVILALFVPVTPAAIGQREFVFARVFALVGVAKPVAVAAAVTWFALGTTFSLLGALSIVIGGRRA